MDLEATGALILRGPSNTLAEIAQPGGALERNDVSIAEDVEFFAR
jgi:hypothetical protein